MGACFFELFEGYSIFTLFIIRVFGFMTFFWNVLWVGVVWGVVSFSMRFGGG